MQNKTHKNILIINGTLGIIGGAEIYSLNLAKYLIQNGHTVTFLAVKNSLMEKEAIKSKIKTYTFKKYRILKNTFQPNLKKVIKKICKKEKINIIHCNIHRETKAAKKVAKRFKAKVVLTCHIPQKLNPKYLKNLDGFIGVNPKITKSANKKELKIKNIQFITPFFDDTKFLNFKTKENKREFFKKNFNIEIKDIPILCTVANIPIKDNHKNHPLLLKAIYKLIYQKNNPVELLLVGGGTGQEKLKNLAKELKINKYVHFLGFTNKVAEILYHSDIKLLTGNNEGCPISLLEAALQKKPLIGTENSGMDTVIINNKNGLLFKQNNVDDLTNKIEILIKNKELQKQFGQNAYEFVKQNYSTKIILEKLEQFYNQIL